MSPRTKTDSYVDFRTDKWVITRSQPLHLFVTRTLIQGKEINDTSIDKLIKDKFFQRPWLVQSDTRGDRSLPSLEDEGGD